MGKHNGRMRKTGLAVGKSLENASRQSKNAKALMGHNGEPDSSLLQQSILDQDDLESMMTMAELAGRDFVAEKQTVVVLDTQSAFSQKQNFTSEEIKAAQSRCSQIVRIPQRPQWTTTETVEELERIEKEAFLNWRRQLAQMQETEPAITLTPYEKNLEVWRQLWRVLERSQVIVQVVDARNPLLYWSKDLEDYVHELDANKKSFLLLNKADLLNEELRALWAEYFEKNDISYAFWSAKSASEATISIQEVSNHRVHIHSTDEVISIFTNLTKECNNDSELKTVGLVGYPNVGKSSTINALFGRKKTPVAATPGRTKHFQTLLINEHLCLCDCPGLVLPKYAISKADMVAAGVIPVDRLTDVISPVAVILSKVGIDKFCKMYGLKPLNNKEINERVAVEMISILAMSRGWTQASGRPDQTKAGRIMIKDFTDGKLFHCELPPGTSLAGLEDDRNVLDTTDSIDLNLIDNQGVTLGPGDDDLLRELTVKDSESSNKPRRAEHKFHKKPPRRKGNRGRKYNEDGPMTSSASIKGNRGSLVNGMYKTQTYM